MEDTKEKYLIEDVKRDVAGRVNRIVVYWEGHSISFFVNAKNSNICKEKGGPNLPAKVYGKILNQLICILKSEEKKQKSKTLALLLISLAKAGVKIFGRGKMKISRWDKKKNGDLELVRQVVNDLSTAIRMQQHILDGYRADEPKAESEISRLTSIELVINRANSLLTSWLASSRADREDLQKKMAEVVLLLQHCRNEFKVATRRQTAEIMTLKDSSGRPNPGALAARTIAAINLLVERMNELHIIMPFIAMRLELIIFVQRWMDISQAKILAKVIGLSRQRTVLGKGREYENKYLRQEINQILTLLNDLAINPYYKTAFVARKKLIALKKMVGAKDFKPEEALKLITEAIKILQPKNGGEHGTHQPN